jgi:O-methyltransferase
MSEQRSTVERLRRASQRARRLAWAGGRRWLLRRGSKPWPGTDLSYVPDRYDPVGGNAERQRSERTFYDEGDFARYIAGNEENNRGDVARWYFLNLTIEQLLKEGLAGDVAELGVYKGNTAAILSRYAERIGGKCYLFDTFEGFSGRDLEGVDASAPRAFEDARFDDVRRLVDSPAAVYVQGWFPDSLAQLADDPRFALVHIDCDLYKPMKSGLEYFYPRLVPGGVLVMHDYMSLCWRGIEQAVDEFFAGKPERLVCIPDKSGTVVVRKV